MQWIGMMPTHWDCQRGKYILRYVQKSVRDDDGVSPVSVTVKLHFAATDEKKASLWLTRKSAISLSALNSWIFNEDTIRQVLHTVMQVLHF